ncbi:MAG TPA: sigma 54-interacting transcriptional regulator [Vicinamibacterales bacterium]|nr:sigma 54-interacting transcriptional regulator [Vicinamibacterales bacterium]
MEIVRAGCRPLTRSLDEERHQQRHGIVGRSHAIASVIGQIELIARTKSTVLITGETGTGKELVARAVHDRSAQRDMPFITVNCAAIPDTLLESELFGHVRGAFTGATGARRGKFALANRSSIFLDEIGTMNVGLQAKLLRVLQEREIEPLGSEHTERVDVRVIAATNKDLVRMVHEGRFQEDLFYRLDVIRIELPPLRDRPEDIPMLAAHFVEKYAHRIGKSIAGLDEQAMSRLVQHPWPGNIRELENTIERAVVLSTGSWITGEAIVPRSIRQRATTIPSLNLRQNVEWVERETIRRALETSEVKRQAAQAMGITPRALTYYLNKYPALNAAPRFGRPQISESAFEPHDEPEETRWNSSDGLARYPSDHSPIE